MVQDDCGIDQLKASRIYRSQSFLKAVLQSSEASALERETLSWKVLNN